MSTDSLYHSMIRAFPRTTKRQHVTDELKVIKMEWTPFVGMKTLLVKGLVESGEKIYDTFLLFKDINYNEAMGKSVPLVASDGMLYHMAKINEKTNDVLVRCNCPDYRWRFAHYNDLAGAHWGAKVKKYESRGGPPANPLGLAGMCKHTQKTIRAMGRAGLFV